MSSPIGGDGFLYELAAEVGEELRLAECSRPEEAVGLPAAEWLFDPADAERDRVGLRGLLGAVQALEDDERRRHDRT
jgi:hypothetical protein